MYGLLIYNDSTAEKNLRKMRDYCIYLNNFLFLLKTKNCTSNC